MAAFPLYILPATDSTNEEAKRRGRAGESGPLAILAKLQTAGRGRHGRQWDSTEGNLHLSFLLPADAAVSSSSALVLSTALAAHQGLVDCLEGYLQDIDGEKSSECRVQHDRNTPVNFEPSTPHSLLRLKWPNDLLRNGKKLGGMLVESEAGTDGKAKFAVLGIGINLKHYPETAHWPATSLAAEGLPIPEPEALAEAIAIRLEQWLQADMPALRSAWLARAWNLGRQARVRLPDGEINGIFEALAEDGALVLRLADGARRVITSGEVVG